MGALLVVMRLGGGLAGVVGVVLVVGHFLLTAATLGALGWAALFVTILVALGGVAMALTRRGMAWGLFFLGFSLCLFGWQAYVYPAVAFGLVVDAATLALVWRNVGREEVGTGLTGALLGSVVCLGLGSMLLLPWDRLGLSLSLLGPTGFFAAMVFSPADTPAYGLAAIWRLAVLAVFARELARCDLPGRFAALVQGVAGGLVTAIVFGLLGHFRDDQPLLNRRLTSIYANSGWFAEYLAVSAPFLLLPLGRRSRVAWCYGATCLALCALGLVLTLARGGWIAGSLTFIFAVWLYWRNGPLARFRNFYVYLPGLAGAGLLVVGLAFWASGKDFSAISQPINATLKDRVGNFMDSPRPALFRSGLLVAADRPVFGLGYESYARHYPVLLAAPTSWLGRYGDPTAEAYETSHNLYIQLVSGLGVSGVVLWLVMVGRAGWVLWRRAWQTASLVDAALLLSLAAFHIYAVFQEMFYVPPVLFLLFLPLSRAMALESGWTTGQGRTAGRARVVSLAAWAVAAAGLVSFLADAGLGRTGERLGLADWRSGPVVFEGFYPPETVAGQTLRWSAGDGVILADPGELELTLYAPQPMDVALISDTGPLGTVHLGGEAVTRRYRLPDAGDGRAHTIFVLPDSAFVPMVQTGAPDPRRLGVAVSARLVEEAAADTNAAGQ